MSKELKLTSAAMHLRSHDPCDDDARAWVAENDRLAKEGKLLERATPREVTNERLKAKKAELRRRES